MKRKAIQSTGYLLPGVPVDWAALIAGIEGTPQAEAFGIGRLARMVYDGEALFAMWLPMLRRHGWTAIELFGVHPIAPAARFDCMGLILVLNSKSVRSISADGASLASPTGTTLSYRREPMLGAVLIWDACADTAAATPIAIAS